jgi:hypothetical protein
LLCDSQSRINVQTRKLTVVMIYFVSILDEVTMVHVTYIIASLREQICDLLSDLMPRAPTKRIIKVLMVEGWKPS